MLSSDVEVSTDSAIVEMELSLVPGFTVVLEGGVEDVVASARIELVLTDAAGRTSIDEVPPESLLLHPANEIIIIKIIIKKINTFTFDFIFFVLSFFGLQKSFKYNYNRTCIAEKCLTDTEYHVSSSTCNQTAVYTAAG